MARSAVPVLRLSRVRSMPPSPPSQPKESSSTHCIIDPCRSFAVYYTYWRFFLLFCVKPFSNVKQLSTSNGTFRSTIRFVLLSSLCVGPAAVEFHKPENRRNGRKERHKCFPPLRGDGERRGATPLRKSLMTSGTHAPWWSFQHVLY